MSNQDSGDDTVPRRSWPKWAALIALFTLTILALVAYFAVWPALRPAIGPVPKVTKPAEKKTAADGANQTGLPLRIPAGFEIETFAEDLGPVRFMALDEHGVLLVSVTGSGKVLALPDQNLDGKADEVITLIAGLDLPHGLAFYKNFLYVAETDKVLRYNYSSSTGNEIAIKISDPTVIVSDLPSGGGHFTRTLGFGPDGKMYVSVGSSGNILKESDTRRAAILRFNPDGTGAEVYARGLRNSVGFRWHPVTKEIWATDNGRDFLGDDLPPDEINIVKKGGDYGWPYAYGNRITDPEFDDPERAAKTVPPKIEIQAHSAPLGLTFYDSPAFGSAYEGDLFVCFHGSWNRSVPTGYKVVRYHLKGTRKDQVVFKQDFITGWLTPQGALGRPVDIIVGADEAVYISDDKGERIYRVSKIQ